MTEGGAKGQSGRVTGSSQLRHDRERDAGRRLEEVARRIDECVAILERESGLRPHHVTDQDNMDLAEPYYGEEGGRLFLRAQERGRLVRDEVHEDVESLVESVMEGLVSGVASTFEVQNRRSGEDFRRQLFHLREQWLAAMDESWGERKRQDHAETLRIAPFDDDYEYRVAAAVHGLAEEMDMRRRVRDSLQTAGRSTDPVPPQTSVVEPPTDRSEWRPWFIAVGVGLGVGGALRLVQAVLDALP